VPPGGRQAPEEPGPEARVKDAPVLVTPTPPRREAVRPCACGRTTDLRCDCGSLLARRVDGGVELKCRRCKRTIVLPLADG
jgi:hypothetical protein